MSIFELEMDETPREESRRGSIELIIGPMFSGKTTELCRRMNRHYAAEETCLMIKYSEDKRYSASEVCSHDGYKMAAISCSTLKDSEDRTCGIKVIGIDEGQFFGDLSFYAEKWAEEGKTVIIAALDGDWRRNRFETVSELDGKCESVVKLNAVCQFCHRDAPFSLARKEITLNIQIGGKETYFAVCRSCYKKHSLTRKP